MPVTYRLQVSTSDLFTSLTYETIVSTTTHATTLPAAEKPYFWRVMAADFAGNLSAPSESQIFQLSWTIPPSKNDRWTNCGAGSGVGAAWLTAGAILAALAGFAMRRRV